MDPSKSDIKFGTSSNRPRKLMLLNVLIVLSVLAATFMVVNMVVTFLGW